MKLNEFLTQAKHFKRIPVSREVNLTSLQPSALFQKIQALYPDAALLENLVTDESPYSFIAFESMANFSSHHTLEPFIALEQMIKEMNCAPPSSQTFFNGSIIGYVNYDAIRLFEAIPNRHANQNELPDIAFNFYRHSIRFEHQTKKLMITTIIETSNAPEKSYLDAQEKISQLLNIVETLPTMTFTIDSLKNSNLTVDTDIDDATFKKMVLRAQEYIRAGDIFQVVLSRVFKTSYHTDPFNIYQALQKTSPTPYMFYLTLGDYIVTGASPEKLVSVEHGKVSVNPIAGTRQRNATIQDQQLIDELLSDEKELAEHVMLVDLARNDLGIVSNPGSVNVEEFLHIKHFSHVSHMTSIVTGQLCNQLNALDAFAASFPAGTLSGAPKIRAMEIIDELETSRRGLYGGAICRLDYSGNLDSCIAIRTAVLKNGVAMIRTGAGIVFDSNPQAEADETRYKAESMIHAIRLAEGEQ